MSIHREKCILYSMHSAPDSSNYRRLEGCRRHLPPLSFVFERELDPRLQSIQLLGRLGLGRRFKCQSVNALQFLCPEVFKLDPVVLSAKIDVSRQNGTRMGAKGDYQ
jgi:hypothetical protein